jgi:penicillin-binding protein 2
MQRTGRLSLPRVVRVRRSVIAQIALAFSVVILLAAAARLQVLEVDEWAIAAKTNRLREVVVPAPRGTIYDRHGLVVAENVVGYRIMLMPGNRDSMNVQLIRLKSVLGLSDQDLARAKRKWAREQHLPMTVMGDAPPDAVARLMEQQSLFPGVLVHEYAKRHYPYGNAVAHMIGYVAEIDEQQLLSPKWEGYKQGWWIGKAGLEAQYEKVIGGQPGSNYLEIDAMGRIKRWLPEEMGVPPVAGHDLQLYLDLDLQRYIQKIWPRQYRGAFVALDPQTGGVLAYYSHPDFDPNQFIGGIPDTLWKRLNDDPSKPLLDRAGGSGAGQPPASTWKLMVAAMALEEKAITPEEEMPYACTGGIYMLGRYARCWVKTGHGRNNLVQGIFNSCDVYFYQVGARIGLKRMTTLGTRMGFQKKTGIDLPNEQRNQFPSGLDYWEKTLGYRPKESEVISLSIGQGPNTMTPLKMATLYATMARPDGKMPEPRLAVTTDSARGIAVDLGLTRQNEWWLRKGMRRVVGPGGTAQLSRLRDWDFVGKTGTAQACAGCSLKDHAWFVGMAGPFGKDPEIVATMFLQNGEHGWLASDYVANAINFYLSRKYGKPFERYPTPRTRGSKGLPVDEKWLWSPLYDPPMPGLPTPDTTSKKVKRAAAAGGN